jgi:hypothetical protein
VPVPQRGLLLNQRKPTATVVITQAHCWYPCNIYWCHFQVIPMSVPSGYSQYLVIYHLIEHQVRSKFPTRAYKKMTVFWNVEPCSLVEVDQRFCLRHQGDKTSIEPKLHFCDQLPLFWTRWVQSWLSFLFSLSFHILLGLRSSQISSAFPIEMIYIYHLLTSIVYLTTLSQSFRLYSRE